MWYLVLKAAISGVLVAAASEVARRFPGWGALIASLPLISWYTTNPMVEAALANKWVLYGLIVLVAWLMVSRLPLMALKFKDYSFRGNMPKLVLLALAVLSAVFLRWLAVPLVFILYIIVSLLTAKKNA